MKNLLLAGLLLSTAPAFAQMQPPPPSQAELDRAGGAGQEVAAPFKGANIIVVETADSAKVALKQLASQLQQKGFTLERVDYELLSLVTKPKPFSGSGLHTMTASAAVVAGKILLRGTWHGQLSTYSVDEPIQYTNKAGRVAFAELEAVAQAYPGGRLRYALKR